MTAPRNLQEAIADLIVRAEESGKSDRFIVLVTDAAVPDSPVAYGPFPGLEAMKFAKKYISGLDSELRLDVSAALILCEESV